MDQEFFITDTETAGLDGGVCDLAIMQIDSNLNVIGSVESLIDPERPITPGASAVHHIVDADVADAPTLAEFMAIEQHPFQVHNPVIAGHNVAFDIRMLGAHIPQVHTRLCTLKLARLVWPDADNHQLQTLRYTFKLQAGPAHRAMGDVVTCLSLLRLVAETRGIDLYGILEMVKRPIDLSYRLTFGKHKGTPLGDLPNSYVDWLLNKADNLDPDVREALTARG